MIMKRMLPITIPAIAPPLNLEEEYSAKFETQRLVRVGKALRREVLFVCHKDSI